MLLRSFVSHHADCERTGCCTFGYTEDEARAKLWQVCADCYGRFCGLTETDGAPQLRMGGFGCSADGSSRKE